jgi:CheY-like chemotaxis protein
MDARKFPFGVRLLGFGAPETAAIAERLAQAPHHGPAYACLPEHSLQEPDLLIVNGDELKALALMSAAGTSDMRPALIVGARAVALPHPHASRPLDWDRIFAQLAQLIEKRADAASLIAAHGMPAIVERRRRERIDFDLTDPAQYRRMRRAPERGALLMVDVSGAACAHVAQLLAKYHIAAAWVDGVAAAIFACRERPVSLILINTSTPGVDAYQLCAAVKALETATRTTVVFLIDAAFGYDPQRARAAGAEGTLERPVADQHLLAAIQKIMALEKG